MSYSMTFTCIKLSTIGLEGMWTTKQRREGRKKERKTHKNHLHKNPVPRKNPFIEAKEMMIACWIVSFFWVSFLVSRLAQVHWILVCLGVSLSLKQTVLLSELFALSNMRDDHIYSTIIAANINAFLVLSFVIVFILCALLDFGLSQCLLPCVTNFWSLERERERRKGFRVLLWPSGPSLNLSRISN
jgi:hypothetical protein